MPRPSTSPGAITPPWRMATRCGRTMAAATCTPWPGLGPTPPPSSTWTRTAPTATGTLSWPSRTAVIPTGQTRCSRRRRPAPASREWGLPYGQLPTEGWTLRPLSSELRRCHPGWRLLEAPPAPPRCLTARLRECPPLGRRRGQKGSHENRVQSHAGLAHLLHPAGGLRDDVRSGCTRAPGHVVRRLRVVHTREPRGDDQYSRQRAGSESLERRAQSLLRLGP